MARRPNLQESLALEDFTRQLDAIRERFQAERLDQRREAGTRQARWLDPYLLAPPAVKAVAAGDKSGAQRRHGLPP